MGCTAYSRTNIGDIAVFCLYDKLPTVLVYPSESKCITNLAHSSEASKPPESMVLCRLQKWAQMEWVCDRSQGQWEATRNRGANVHVD
jgi:hypothetical protein